MRKRDRHVPKKDVFPASVQALKPLRVRDVAIATSEEPHPNPPLAKGRGPEVMQIQKNPTLTLPLLRGGDRKSGQSRRTPP